MTADVLPVTARADHAAGPAQGHWTYSDYAALPDDGNRYEIVDGVLYMAPAPTTFHQSANRWFVYYFTAHFQIPGLGHVFAAPTDVELGPHDVVQPDVIVVLSGSTTIIPSRIIGALDLVVESGSPSTAGYDRREKQDAYARAGVAEFWVADPNAQTIELLVLDGGAYRSLGLFQGKATLPSRVATLPVHVEQFFL